VKKNAALYLRSSKDRNDVSPAAQRRKLEELANSSGLTIVAEFVDVEESAKDEDRPAFLQLLRSFKDQSRGWSTLLVYDTSRLARRRYIAQAFKHEARKRGISIRYAMLPADLDPIAEVVLESSFEAYDEVHSLMSRQKGLLGMRENVARGFRAGGRAPVGYRLEHQPTGAVRDGKPVMKSHLVVSDKARVIRAYLKGRSRGIPRARLARDLKLALNPSSLVGVEWNALTYAGHTVWNVHSDAKGARRRPRAEWVVKRDTHEALITDAEAEGILAELSTSRMSEAISRAKAAMSAYLLTGMLVTEDGRKWTGRYGRFYKLKGSERGPGCQVRTDLVDRAVLAQIASDMRSDTFLEQLLEASRRAGVMTDPARPLKERIARLEREKGKAAELALAAEDSQPFVRLVQERSDQIAALRAELEAVESDSALIEAVRRLTPAVLRELLLELGGPAAALQAMVARVVLEPDLSCRVDYRAAGALSMASPRGYGRSVPVLSQAVLLRRAG